MRLTCMLSVALLSGCAYRGETEKTSLVADPVLDWADLHRPNRGHLPAKGERHPDDECRPMTFFHAGDFHYEVSRVWWSTHVSQNRLSSSDDFIPEGDDTAHPNLLASITVRNDGDTPAQIPEVTLADGKRTYAQSSDGYLAEDRLGRFEIANPGSLKEYTLIFDVWPGDYRIVFMDSADKPHDFRLAVPAYHVDGRY